MDQTGFNDLHHSRGVMSPLENTLSIPNYRGRLRKRFYLVRKLGEGTDGKVELGIHKETGQDVAIKTIKKSRIKSEKDLLRIRREIYNMSALHHPNIVRLYEVFESSTKIVLVMEYAAGGELFDYLLDHENLGEEEIRRIFRQIASAVYYCHQHNICHRDLKLENILLDDRLNAKLADFGFSNVFDGITLLKTSCGSPVYASPEIVAGSAYKGPEVDCWSLGVILYAMVYRGLPFRASNMKTLFKVILKGDYFEPPEPSSASPLIRRMLTLNPKYRASIREICGHPWVNLGCNRDCLTIAEELVIENPARIGSPLSPGNGTPTSFDQIGMEQQPNDGGTTSPSTGDEASGGTSDDMILINNMAFSTTSTTSFFSSDESTISSSSGKFSWYVPSSWTLDESESRNDLSCSSICLQEDHYDEMEPIEEELVERVRARMQRRRQSKRGREKGRKNNEGGGRRRERQLRDHAGEVGRNGVTRG